jgi:hypothetical protein
MIKYALICENEHAFEGWFGSSADYDAQQAKRLVECPACGSAAVRKQIMAPALAGVRQTVQDEAPGKSREMMMQAMGRIRQHVMETFDDVGDAFASEARAIHEGRSEERGIYGQASQKEVRALLEDGVPVAPMPPEPPKKTEVN